jgi:hypothetical protein
MSTRWLNCFSELALWKSNSACWSSTKRTSSSYHWKLTCSRHDIAEKLLNLRLTTITHSFWIRICKIMTKKKFLHALQCTKYNDLRKKYIKKYYWFRPSTFKLVQLLSVENREELCTLGKFIHLACKARNNLVRLSCVFIIIVHNFLTYLCYFLLCHIYIVCCIIMLL